MASRQIRMFGAPWCPDCQRAKQFMAEQRIAYEWNDIDQDESARAYVQQVNDGKQIIPTIVFDDGSILVEPSNAELAAKLGIQQQASRSYYDLVIVGGGPTALAAGIYTAREGLSTLIIERAGVGGQAGITQEIENYPGFPEPISGAELAGRLRRQSERFGVEVLSAQEVTSLERDGDNWAVKVRSGDEYCCPAVVVATGATYRRLGVPGESDLIGAGIHFCATCDGPFYKGQDVVVVGGGNSGFQEGVFLTKFAKSVTIIERSDRVKASQALQDKVAGRDDMKVLMQTTIERFEGNGRLSSIVLKDGATGRTTEMSPGAVFVFIGLLPNTELVRGLVELDDLGFIVTRSNLETSVSGLFAAGDCRHGSTKQVASAVGEGATVALMVREYLERKGDVAPVPVEAPAS
ncbi:MAG: FAD-dependent oxidoreductase [Chloroflexi bacterium]|nr:FAD-dependent oxidoreductase [Chloroflexota bacterium]